ncbi:LLM class flavin-dependent oxidoreductase [Streptomyces sp. NBC_01264]|uniref:LLM class flavin-dependent oxidoreductase n=1 Tax=Streptomyces sp. NBC_01264 TaxID=2903804 RepID=UPI002258F22E|nr:LLM class flavin-dependent oxidoreductase [Streptomyces sp. NBC_01264]MCX4778553.1 LLM class flavin-dependent oxidoreductase [Streptomyces sp. NBC_01264]
MRRTTVEPLRIHWDVPTDGGGQAKPTEKYKLGALDMGEITDFVKEAEELGVDSLLFGIGHYLPDPVPIIAALTQQTERVKFMLAYRPGLLSPTLFTQIVNTLSWMSDDRLSLNVVAGISVAEQAGYGDFLDHDQRYARSGEFLHILREFWEGEVPQTFDGQHYTIKDAELHLGYKGGKRPEIYISGASEVAQQTALTYGDCWMRYGDTPEGMRQASLPLIEGGCRVGTRMHVLARETREEALAELAELMGDPDVEHEAWIREFVKNVDSEAVKSSFRLADQASEKWLSPYIYTGAVPYRGGPALCLVGSYQEVADYLFEYKQAGISEFIFSGWPTRPEMRTFFTHVVPLIRELERDAQSQS